MDLFRARGWTAIITNNLIGYVSSYTAFGISLIVGLIGVLLEVGTSRYMDDPTEIDTDDGAEHFSSYIFGPLPGPYYWAFGYVGQKPIEGNQYCHRQTF